MCIADKTILVEMSACFRLTTRELYYLLPWMSLRRRRLQAVWYVYWYRVVLLLLLQQSQFLPHGPHALAPNEQRTRARGPIVPSTNVAIPGGGDR